MTNGFKAFLAGLSILFVWMFGLITYVPSLGHSWSLWKRLASFYNGKIVGWEAGSESYPMDWT